MSNRKLNPATGRKEYIPRAVRRARRNETRATMGAPPERPVRGAIGANGHLLGSLVEPYDPETGEAIGPAHPPAIGGNPKTAFLIEGVQFVYEGLGGHRAFLEWAQHHETKFRELAMKLLPSQVNIQANQLGNHVTIQHALPPPNYDASKGATSNQAETVRQALLNLSEQERAELLKTLAEPVDDV